MSSLTSMNIAANTASGLNAAANSLYRPELLAEEYRPRVSAYYFRQWEGFRMDAHSHDRVEIMYVLKGACVVDTEGASLSLKKGDFVLLDANVSHNLLVGDPCRMLNVEFEFASGGGVGLCLRELAAGGEELGRFLAKPRPFWLLKDDGEVYPTLKSLVLELSERRGSRDTMVQLLLSRLILQIARMAEETDTEGASPASSYFRKTTEYIHSHYDCDLQLKDIAGAVSLHPGYLHRVFKASAGCTVMEYLTKVRVEKARMLLAHSDIPVIDISGYIGMNSRQYFSAVFKKHTGQTPAGYRRTFRTHQGAETEG